VEFVVDEVALGQVLLGFFSVFPCQYHSTVALNIHIIWGMNKRPVGGLFLRQSQPIDMKSQKKKPFKKHKKPFKKNIKNHKKHKPGTKFSTVTNLTQN
jgi:hypothetical protein